MVLSITDNLNCSYSPSILHPLTNRHIDRLVEANDSSQVLRLTHEQSTSVSIYDNSLVDIGDRVLIGPGVCICTGTHAIDAKSR